MSETKSWGSNLQVFNLHIFFQVFLWNIFLICQLRNVFSEAINARHSVSGLFSLRIAISSSLEREIRRDNYRYLDSDAGFWLRKSRYFALQNNIFAQLSWKLLALLFSSLTRARSAKRKKRHIRTPSRARSRARAKLFFHANAAIGNHFRQSACLRYYVIYWRIGAAQRQRSIFR